MLKKLQNLLFEDDDDDYLDDEEPEEVEQPVKVRPVVHSAPEQVKQAPAVQPQASEPVRQTEQPHMNRIDVTGFVPVQNEKKEEPVRQPVKEEKKTLGITADGYRAPEKPKAVKTVKAAKPKTQKPAKKAPQKTAYEFQPVISPIFGVDEKDLTALKTTTRKVAEINSHAEDDGNITPVISPIYGSTQKQSSYEEKEEAKPASVQEPDVKAKAAAPAKAADDEIPEFSLDDILKVRDEEYDSSSDDLSNTAPLFPDLDLKFPDDPAEKPAEEEPDQTQVITKPKTSASRKK